MINKISDSEPDIIKFEVLIKKYVNDVLVKESVEEKCDGIVLYRQMTQQNKTTVSMRGEISAYGLSKSIINSLEDDFKDGIKALLRAISESEKIQDFMITDLKNMLHEKRGD
jgi:hypothetical protein